MPDPSTLDTESDDDVVSELPMACASWRPLLNVI